MAFEHGTCKPPHRKVEELKCILIFKCENTLEIKCVCVAEVLLPFLYADSDIFTMTFALALNVGV